MTLDSFLKMYYAQARDVRESTIKQYAWCILSFSKFLGRPALLSDLRQDAVNEWVKWLCSRGSRETAKSRRMTLLSIWNCAAALGYVNRRTEFIRTVKTPQRIVKSLTQEQCLQIMQEARNLRGRLFRCPKGQYMASLIRGTLETSLRQSDLHALEWPDVLANRGRLQIVQRKSGIRRWVFLSEDLLAKIGKWHGPDGLIWPRGDRATVGKILQQIGRKMGIRLTHTRLRVASITDVERQSPNAGWRFAGHSCPTTTQRWYTDLDMSAEGIPRPSFFG